MEDRLFTTDPVPTENVKILVRTPVPYNQNYTAYKGPNPADGACVSGCAPVAWAMFESAFATGARSGLKATGSTDYGNIYRNQEDWRLTWGPSPFPNPSKSPAVNQRIWTFHSVMNTDCDGGTLPNWIGLPVMNFNQTWEFNVMMEGRWHQKFSDCRRLMSGEYPIILTGTGFPQPDISTPLTAMNKTYAVLYRALVKKTTPQLRTATIPIRKR
jgi:hypothetical protein